MVKKALANVVLNGLALYITILIIKDVSYTGGWKFFLIAGLIFAFANTIIKPFLKLLSLPFIFITAGIFIVVINAGILWLVEHIIKIAHFQDVTFQILKPSAYLWISLVFGAINWIEHFLFNKSNN